MGCATLIFFLLPWLDQSPVKSIRYKGPLTKTALALFVIVFFVLGYLGTLSVTEGGTHRRADLHVALLRVLPADAVVHDGWTRRSRSRTGSRVERRTDEATRSGSSLSSCSCARRAGARRRHRRASSSTARPINAERPRLAAARRARLRQLLPRLPQRGYMRYNRLQDLGLTEQQIRDNLIFTGAKVGDLMKIAMDPKDAKEWFGARAAGSDRDRALALLAATAAARTGSTPTCAASTATPPARPAGTTPSIRTSACRTCSGSCRASRS